MRSYLDRNLISMALAIFSMFFGAGNAIFPLILGIEAQNQYGTAFLGLLLTAIGGPLLGLLGATLCHGKFVSFFRWTGRIPSAIFITVTLALLGPFAVLPRCVTVAYAATASMTPSLSLCFFALIFCVLALFTCWKQQLILPTLGHFLSPLLIGCLLLIIYQGYTSSAALVTSDRSGWEAFILGLSTGYDTMDLIASIYFSSGIWMMITLQNGSKGAHSASEIFKRTLKAGTLGCLFLALIYYGLTRAAANFSQSLGNIPPEKLMTHLANITLGRSIGTVANIAILLACLTTVVSLTMTISHILSKEIFPGKVSYHAAVYGILIITAIMSNLGFEAIMGIIHPIVSACYPFIILLTLVNIYRRMT